ncbi:MAG: hypothetical protein M1840_004876 [Geoglossum simile]|nr:MAG: hypothetical protein M1840_004876 [Geoglossum simile]
MDLHYEPLPQRSIRLVCLRPGHGTLLDIRLSVHSLDKPLREYSALSYTWDSQPSNSSELNSPSHFVTPNCEAALRRLRRPDTERYLWIDSICINQNDPAEKSEQIPLMLDIYSLATEVIIWLGQSTIDSDLAFRQLRQAAELARRPGGLPIEDLRVAMDIFAVQMFELHESTSLLVNPITDVISRPWFSRTWTLQEVVLNDNPYILCGEDEGMPWDSFLLALKTLADVDRQGRFSLEYETLYNATISQRQLRKLVDQCRGTDPNTSTAAQQTPYFSYVLSRVHPKSTTKSRDKIYGIYGLLRLMGIRNLPPVDYNLSVERIYTDATQAAIQHDNSLMVLHWLNGNARLPLLPSWVPDWSDSSPIAPIVSSHFQASIGSTVLPRFALSCELLLSGVCVGEVVTVASESPNILFTDNEVDMPSSERASSGLASFLFSVAAFQEWIHLGLDRQIYVTGERCEDAFCRTITLDGAMHDGAGGYIPEHFLGTFQDWYDVMTANDSRRQSITMDELRNYLDANELTVPTRRKIAKKWGVEESDLPDDDEVHIVVALNVKQSACSFHQVAFAASGHRIFFKTEGAYMGLGPRPMRTGDVVVLLSGLRLPMIARRSSTGQFRLIGPAYVHGMMNGERWPKDAGLLQEFTFV